VLEPSEYVAGYGRIEPQTTSGRLFCVLFGVIGIPSTIIIVSHFGKYLDDFKNYLRRKFRRHRQTKSNEIEDEDEDEDDDDNRTTVALLFIMIMCYLLIGACILPLLSGRFDFLNGFYFAFLCFSANEFGATIPDKLVYCFQDGANRILVSIFYLLLSYTYVSDWQCRQLRWMSVLSMYERCTILDENYLTLPMSKYGLVQKGG
jgi:hypothetical protein